MASLVAPADTADAFLRRAQRRNPKRYADVAARFPVLSRWNWRQIARNEILAGDVRSLPQR